MNFKDILNADSSNKKRREEQAVATLHSRCVLGRQGPTTSAVATHHDFLPKTPLNKFPSKHAVVVPTRASAPPRSSLHVQQLQMGPQGTSKPITRKTINDLSRAAK